MLQVVELTAIATRVDTNISPWNFDISFEIGSQTQLRKWSVYITLYLNGTEVGWPKAEIWGWAKDLLYLSIIFTYLSHLNLE
jgi:hypothetical protein